VKHKQLLRRAAAAVRRVRKKKLHEAVGEVDGQRTKISSWTQLKQTATRDASTLFGEAMAARSSWTRRWTMGQKLKREQQQNGAAAAATQRQQQRRHSDDEHEEEVAGSVWTMKQ